MTPPVVRAPNGVVQDGAEFFGAGKPYYDPAKITGRRRMGPRCAALHDTDPVSAAGELSGKTLRRAG
jgi:hypothetical protein